MDNANNQTVTGDDAKKTPEITQQAGAASGDGIIDAQEATKDADKATQASHPQKLGILNNVTVSLTVEVGRAHIKIRDLLNLTKGSIIELNKSAGEPVDVYVNGKLISIGNVITANGKYCVRLTSMPDNEDIEVRPDDQ